jgi:hypothetical protein
LHKFVGKNEDVAELFAQGGTSGQSYNETMFIEGDKLYSYGHHFPIAKVDRVNKVAWFNNDSYSVTTSIHKGRVKRNLERYGFKLIPSNTEELQKM